MFLELSFQQVRAVAQVGGTLVTHGLAQKYFTLGGAEEAGEYFYPWCSAECARGKRVINTINTHA